MQSEAHVGNHPPETIIVLLFGRDTSIYTTAYKRYVIANEWFILACHVTREQ